jgi:hypothetical protein
MKEPKVGIFRWVWQILFVRWIIFFFAVSTAVMLAMSDSEVYTSATCEPSSSQQNNTESDMTVSDMERNLTNLEMLAAVGQANADLNRSRHTLPRLERLSEIHTAKKELPEQEYIEFLQKKHDAIHRFLDQHARKGSSMRKQLDKALSESPSSSSDSAGRPRSLSKTQFDELLEIIGKAAERLEVKHKKKKKEVKLLRTITIGATALGSCTGAAVASFCTALVAGVLALFLSS